MLNSHPIQYFAPLYRRLAELEGLELSVFYCSRQGVGSGFNDSGFGQQVVWDTPLLDGYRYSFLASAGTDRGVGGGFFSLTNPGIIRELHRGGFDAVIVHGHQYFTNLLAILGAKWFGTAVFMRGETHLLLERRGLKRVLRRPIMSMLYRLCDACLYIGSRNRAFYERHSVHESKLFFVPYTVDNDFFRSASAAARADHRWAKTALGIPEGVPVILYASKLVGRKRPLDLLRAYQEVRQHGVRAALVFVGDGPERSGLEAYVAGQEVPDVHFVGFKNQTELPAYYASADVFALPSENEPWGLIINEVMSAGVPVVTTEAVGAAADLVTPGVTGLRYPVGDVDALARCLGTILSDDSLRSRMSANCIARMRDWSYDQCIDGILDALTVRSRRSA